MPVAGGGLGLDVYQWDAVDEEQHIRADTMIAAIDPELVGRKKIVVLQIVVINQLDRLGFLVGTERVGLLVAHPLDPFGIVAEAPQLGENHVGAGVVRDDAGVQLLQLLPEDGQEQHLHLIRAVALDHSRLILEAPAQIGRHQPFNDGMLDGVFFVPAFGLRQCRHGVSPFGPPGA